jgi:hypothetical protein
LIAQVPRPCLATNQRERCRRTRTASASAPQANSTGMAGSGTAGVLSCPQTDSEAYKLAFCANWLALTKLEEAKKLKVSGPTSLLYCTSQSSVLVAPCSEGQSP